MSEFIKFNISHPTMDVNSAPESDILIVEDELSSLAILEDALGGESNHIVPVCTEAGANKHLRKPFDLFIIDLNLPDGSGLNLIKRIRQLNYHADTPIIVTTGSDASSDIVASFQAGASDYLVKPFNSLILRCKARLLLRYKSQLKLLQQEAKTDPLTRLLNRQTITLKAQSVWQRSKVTGLPFSTVAVDINGLHGFNEKFGYDAGDKLLTDVAKVLTTTVDQSEHYLGRLESDNFVVLLPDKKLADALDKGKQLLSSLHQFGQFKSPWKSAENPFSIGIAEHCATTVIEPADVFYARHHKVA